MSLREELVIARNYYEMVASRPDMDPPMCSIDSAVMLYYAGESAVWLRCPVCDRRKYPSLNTWRYWKEVTDEWKKSPGTMSGSDNT